MSPPVTRLYDIARAFLDAVVDGWPAEAPPLPSRRYVSNGLVFWDCCETLAVEVERTFGIEADPSVEQIIQVPGLLGMRAATIAVWLIRKVVDIDEQGEAVVFPAADEIEDDAQVVLADAQAVLNVLIDAQRAGTLATCQGVAFENWTAQGPEGGLGGGVLRVRAMLL